MKRGGSPSKAMDWPLGAEGLMVPAGAASWSCPHGNSTFPLWMQVSTLKNQFFWGMDCGDAKNRGPIFARKFQNTPTINF